MFELFAKVAWLLLAPSALLTIAMLRGLWHQRQGDHTRSKRWLFGAIAAVLLCGLSSLSDLLILPLENRFPRPDLTNASIDGIIVIGGAENTDVAASRNVIAVNDAAARYIETVAMARRFPRARVVFSGGGEILIGASEPEAVTAARIFEQLGIARDRITLEDRSRTTWENAVLTAAIINQKPGERWLLITSAWQMPRAVGAFRRAGLKIDAYPVDYRTTGAITPWLVHRSLSDGLRKFDYVLREYPALLIYWLSGRTTALFPGP